MMTPNIASLPVVQRCKQGIWSCFWNKPRRRTVVLRIGRKIAGRGDCRQASLWHWMRDERVSVVFILIQPDITVTITSA